MPKTKVFLVWNLLISGKILTLQQFSLPRPLYPLNQIGGLDILVLVQYVTKDISVQHWSRPFAGRTFVGNNKIYHCSLEIYQVPILHLKREYFVDKGWFLGFSTIIIVGKNQKISQIFT